MTVRRAIMVLACLLWAILSCLTVYVLVASGPDPLVLLSVLVCVLLGAAVAGAIGGARG